MRPINLSTILGQDKFVEKARAIHELPIRKIGEEKSAPKALAHLRTRKGFSVICADRLQHC